jgi:hypothetical protein
MIVQTLAAGDLFTAIPSMWNDARVPLAIVVIAIGAIIAASKLSKGVGTAIGLFIAAAVLAALVIGSSGLVATIKQTTDVHGGLTVGQYGR